MERESKCLYCYRKLNNSETDYHQRCSVKIFGCKINPVLDMGIKDIEKLASEAINRSLSIPGVQKKLSLELIRETKGARLTIVGVWGSYILKPPSGEYRELPEIEDLTMHLAGIAGIETAVHSLIRFKSGELAYIAKRFDRENGDRISVEDMNQLSGNLTSDKYYGSVEKISKLINKYCTYNLFETIKFFKLLIFCFITGNADMHLKNFSIMKESDGHIKLSPAYDLLSTKLVIPEDKEESALTINGKKRNINYNDFQITADTMKIEEKTRANIFADLKNNIPDMFEVINKSFLSEKMKFEYINLVSERAKALKFI
jgi:serine/threonine-protein kinase HipA